MPVTHIAYKDLMLLGRDRRALVILFIMPLIFIAILGVSTGKLIGWKEKAAALQVALVDLSGDPLVDRIVEHLRGNNSVDLDIIATQAEARAMMSQSQHLSAVIIGPSFRDRIDALELGDILDMENGRLSQGLRSIDIECHASSDHSLTASLTEQLTFAACVRTIAPHLAGRDPLIQAYLATRSGSDTADGASASVDQPVGAMSMHGSSPSMDDMVYRIIVPGYAVTFTFFLINIMARSFIQERNAGTLYRLVIAPIGIGSLMLGKTIPFLTISVLQGLLLFLSGKVLFGMSWGAAPWMLLPVILCTSLAATGLGLLTAVLIRTEAQVSAYANLVVITLAGISGCFMPRQWLPETMKQLSLATPHAWSLIAFDQVLNHDHPDLTRVATYCMMLLLFAVAFFLVGWFRFRAMTHD